MSDTDLDAMALAIADYARSNNAWPDDIHTIADAFDLLVSSAEAAAGSEHTHDSYYGTRPWPTTNDDFLPHRLRRTAPEPVVPRPKGAGIARGGYSGSRDAESMGLPPDTPSASLLRPKPVVPSPESDAPTLAEDVETVEQRMEGNAFARAALRRVIAAALAGEVK